MGSFHKVFPPEAFSSEWTAGSFYYCKRGLSQPPQLILSQKPQDLGEKNGKQDVKKLQIPSLEHSFPFFPQQDLQREITDIKLTDFNFMQLSDSQAVSSLALACRSTQPYWNPLLLVPDIADSAGEKTGPCCQGHDWQVSPGWPADKGRT